MTERKDRREFETETNALVFRCLVEEGFDITPQNVEAFKRRAQDHYGTILKKDLSLTYGSEWHIILHKAAKSTFARIGRKKRNSSQF